jgi:hypothetical protein
MCDNIIGIDEQIQIIMRQTDYNEDFARKKLVENNYDHLIVIKKYFGISDKKETYINKKNLNQEIFKQIRFKLDSSMREYKDRSEKNN